MYATHNTAGFAHISIDSALLNTTVVSMNTYQVERAK